MAPADLRTWPDDLHESVWNDLLLAGRPARLSRYGWPGHAGYRPCVRFGRPRPGRSIRPCRSAFHVLAFCGCRFGGCFYRGLRHRALKPVQVKERGEEMGTMLDAGTTD